MSELERVERLTRRLLAFGASTATARRIATAAVYGFEFLLEDQHELDRAQLAPAIRRET